jgi:cation:H+ antiporter
MIKSIVYIVGGLVWLGLWAHLLVGAAKSIALSFWVSESVVGLTIIAFGTSLPELATSIIASLKRDADIAIGNVVGSNIFNILLVLWATGSVANIVVPQFLLTDILIELAAIMLLIVTMFFIGGKWVLTRFEWGVFLLLYFVYIGYIFQTQVL